jgi:hypothetical protein
MPYVSTLAQALLESLSQEAESLAVLEDPDKVFVALPQLSFFFLEQEELKH